MRNKKQVSDDSSQIVGPARVDRRTKELTKRLKTGEIAIIDHEDLDTVAADALVAIGPRAVLNAAQSISGRYPNMGPKILLDAGIPLLDDLGSAIMDIRDGQQVFLTDDGQVQVAGKTICQGQWLSNEQVQEMMDDAKDGMALQIKAFAANTMDYVEKEASLIFDGAGVPDVRTSFEGRHVLVVVRGYNYKKDLEALAHYIREFHPLIIGVDGGADAVLEAGFKLDVIVGDMDSVSDKALKSGAEIIVHAYRDGRAPGLSRVEELGVQHVVFPFTGTSEDVAMILADEKGASLIVAVGTHTTIAEFLDKGRNGMASTFLTRLRVGSKLVDAKGVSRLYRTRIATWQLVLLIIAGCLAVAVALATTAFGQTFFGLVGAWWDSLWSWVTHLF